MQPYRRILRADRWSDSLYTIPYNPKTLTCQYSIVRTNPPGTPLCGPVTWNPARTLPRSTLRLCLNIKSRNLRRCDDHCEQSDTESRARPLTRKVSDASTVIGIGSSTLATISDSTQLTVSNWIQLTIYDWIRLTVSDLI